MTGSRMVQTYWRVVRAEARRELRLPALWILLAIACGAGLAAGLGTVAVVNSSGSSGLAEGAGGTLPVQVSASVIALVLAVGFLAATAGSTTDGTVTTSMILVPRSGRLLWARALVPPVFGGATAAVVGLVVGVVQLATGGDAATTGQQLVGIGMSTAAVSLLLLIVFLGATLMRRGAYTVAAFLLVVLVLPLVAAIVTFIGSPATAEVAGAVARATPGALLVSALSVPFAAGETWRTVAEGSVGLVAWCVALAPLASWQFRREGSRTD